jgi:hypothetical protein
MLSAMMGSCLLCGSAVFLICASSHKRVASHLGKNAALLELCSFGACYNGTRDIPFAANVSNISARLRRPSFDCVHSVVSLRICLRLLIFRVREWHSPNDASQTTHIGIGAVCLAPDSRHPNHRRIILTQGLQAQEAKTASRSG